MSRRSAFSGLAAGGLGLAMASQGFIASAKEQQPSSPSSHPIVGSWLTRSGNGVGLATFAADGSFTQGVPANWMGPKGVVFGSMLMGRWESGGQRSVHYTALQILSDADGVFTGTVTTDGDAVVSADGLSLLESGLETSVITRDAADAVISFVSGKGGVWPMVGRRLGPGAAIYQAGPPATEPRSS